MKPVYPRPRGGAPAAANTPAPGYGLSPPTRGSHRHVAAVPRSAGSIPAHAGEPTNEVGSVITHRVYPRPRGGAEFPAAEFEADHGLSPPTWGSPPVPTSAPYNIRSIPAHAGEPQRSLQREILWRVYPRPRGGAISWAAATPWSSGLSPPTRGSPPAADAERAGRRSIPAHAGEPPRSRRRPPPHRVYPRPRGGAGSCFCRSSPGFGLSPPTRGSPWRQAAPDLREGSIPAHAGEPQQPVPPPSCTRVYPRPRGGASTESRAQQLLNGLSPPTRGSHCLPHHGTVH